MFEHSGKRSSVFSDKVIQKLYGRKATQTAPQESHPPGNPSPKSSSIDSGSNADGVPKMATSVVGLDIPSEQYLKMNEPSGKKVYGAVGPPGSLPVPGEEGTKEVISDVTVPENDAEEDSCSNCKKMRVSKDKDCANKPNLTKNQKRKLKKKRRKDRLKAEQGQEFVYEEQSASTDKQLDAEVTNLKDFFTGIWEVYSREVVSGDTIDNTEEQTKQNKAFLSMLENLDHWPGDLIQRLQSLKALLAIGISQTVAEKLEAFHQYSCISEEELELLQTLSTYWMKNIINFENEPS